MSATENEIIQKALEDPEMVHIPKLVGDLMSANFRNYSATVKQQVELLEQMVADRDAELAAIRVRINELFGGDFMPTETAIMTAVFYPRKELLEQMRERTEVAS